MTAGVRAAGGMSDGASPRPTIKVVTSAAPMRPVDAMAVADGRFPQRSPIETTSTDPTRALSTTTPTVSSGSPDSRGTTSASQTAASAASSTKTRAMSPRAIGTNADKLGRAGSGSTRPRGSNRDHAEGTSAPADQLERCGYDDGPGRRQPIQLTQARQPELACPVHRGVIGKRRRE